MKTYLYFTPLLLLFCANTLFSQSTTYVCPPCDAQCDELTFDRPGNCPHCAMTLISQEEAAAGPVSVAFYLQNGVEVLDFSGPMEVFAYAGFDVFTVSKSKDPIVSQGILTILPDYDLSDAPQADIVAFFGGNAGAAANDSAVVEWVKNREVDYHFSVCTGAFVLGEAGILDGQTATTFHRALDDFEQRFPSTQVRRDVRYVDNGRIITTAGISAGIDGALHLVARLRGFNAARSAAYHMEYDKWTPGEGLILGKDNPYAERPGPEALAEYVGTYTWLENETIQLRVDNREKELIAILPGGTYPVYFQNRDFFTDVQGDEVRFQRDDSGGLTGFVIEGVEDVFQRILEGSGRK